MHWPVRIALAGDMPACGGVGKVLGKIIRCVGNKHVARCVVIYDEEAIVDIGMDACSIVGYVSGRCGLHQFLVVPELL